MRHRIGSLPLVAIGVLTLVACVPFMDLAIKISRFARISKGPSIGDPEQAEIKIHVGMSKDEVRSLLGHPYWPKERSDSRNEWTYRCDAFGGTLFRVYFGPDNRVTQREWWVD